MLASVFAVELFQRNRNFLNYKVASIINGSLLWPLHLFHPFLYLVLIVYLSLIYLMANCHI